MSRSIQENEELIDLETAVDLIDELTWAEDVRADLVGLEIEAFPIAEGPGSGSRLPLHGPGGLIETLGRGLDPSQDSSLSDPPFFAMGAGRVTFEPGGQIELSSSARWDTSTLRAEVESSWDVLEEVLCEAGTDLVCLGLDPWQGVDEVPLQQRFGRYVAMDRYFHPRWPAGTVMMRNTCSLQVNLDAGRGRTRDERWLVANLMSPVLGAMFSTSPGIDGVACRRARTWLEIDPTRTGFPRWSGPGSPDPLEDVRKRALSAQVMFVRRGDVFVPLESPLTFAEWIRTGHPRLGSPTVDDLRTHLSTIFTEVRPRAGILELRAVDSLPRKWWMVPAVLGAAILYDPEARGRAIELLSPMTGRLDLMWRLAAAQGLSTPELADAAIGLFEIALDAAEQDDRFGAGEVVVAEEFLNRFTRRGQSPADELGPLLLDGDGMLDEISVELSGAGCS
ncbi:MAG: glutamate-cysteine ligase family protein [Actinomycetota bacterium]